MKKEFADNLIQLRLTTARLSEGQGDGAGLFTIKYQILFLLEKHGKTSPRIIIHELSLAKSNLALIARDLIREGLICKDKDVRNKKEIFYSITEKGMNDLEQKRQTIENYYNDDLAEACCLLEKVNTILNKIN